jgi:hypothetical protein
MDRVTHENADLEHCACFESSGRVSVPVDTIAILKECLEIIDMDIKEVGPCEHSVNICVCGLESTAERIRSILTEIEKGGEG